jgi:HEPN domain-containing protein
MFISRRPPKAKSSMKQREQALLLLRKAAQDEALLDAVITSDKVSDEIIGFHCQQAAEKILKALLSDVGVRFRKTHEIGALMALLAEAGYGLPDQFENLDALTPFGAIYRYEDYDAVVSLNRDAARSSLRELRAWVETKFRECPDR